MTDEQLVAIKDILGEQDGSYVSYIKLVCLLQDRPITSELKGEVEKLSPLINIHFRPDRQRYIESCRVDVSKYGYAKRQQSLQELRFRINELLQNKFHLFCKVFIDVCRNDECTADKEKLDTILQRLNIVLLPPELEKLWYSLPISYPVEAISLSKFLHHFSKLKPPKDIGKAEDNPVVQILTKLRGQVVHHWKDVKSVLKARDPQGTGQVPVRDIYALLVTLNFQILPSEINMLCKAFDLHMDGQFHYLSFLKFYTRKLERKQI
ncbi:uncharacterized protein LOC122814820 [Protopterus annectens]|uniref:uncharacterized protein LOC122814820 n=1 Tax=Protopterus annectens TaxID=7888 RepID=UPI001CFC273A|nr:uncharacterized protein LOC122814820 [Protopterus annectens]